jgi:hypothetical protein
VARNPLTKIQFLILSGLWLLSIPAFADPAAPSPLLHSPKGHFDIRFQPQEHRLYPTPNERSLAPGIKSQIYSISFYLSGKDTAIAMVYFTDIQHSAAEKFPTPLTTLLGHMVWSPDEDFVVLPKENWPAQTGEIIPRQAVSLRTSSVWQTADFALQTEGLIWINPLQAIGNTVDGCRHDVKEFDGGSGRTLAYQSADSPEGYEILSSNGKTVVLKKVLGDCANDADRQAFHADCIIMDISFGRREIGSCPP